MNEIRPLERNEFVVRLLKEIPGEYEGEYPVGLVTRAFTMNGHVLVLDPICCTIIRSFAKEGIDFEAAQLSGPDVTVRERSGVPNCYARKS